MYSNGTVFYLNTILLEARSSFGPPVEQKQIESFAKPFRLQMIKLRFYWLIRLWRPMAGQLYDGQSIKLGGKQLKFLQRLDKAK